MKEGDIEVNSSTGIALFFVGRKNKNKNSVECFHCHKCGHIALNCKIRAKDIFKGKLKELANLAISKDISDAIFEDSVNPNSDRQFTSQSLKLF